VQHFKTWFVVGILRFQKWFDADVLGFQIKLCCRYSYFDLFSTWQLFGLFFEKNFIFSYLLVTLAKCNICSLTSLKPILFEFQNGGVKAQLDGQDVRRLQREDGADFAALCSGVDLIKLFSFVADDEA
jgi:hypothetical protein